MQLLGSTCSAACWGSAAPGLGCAGLPPCPCSAPAQPGAGRCRSAEPPRRRPSLPPRHCCRSLARRRGSGPLSMQGVVLGQPRCRAARPARPWCCPRHCCCWVPSAPPCRRQDEDLDQLGHHVVRIGELGKEMGQELHLQASGSAPRSAYGPGACWPWPLRAALRPSLPTVRASARLRR